MPWSGFLSSNNNNNSSRNTSRLKIANGNNFASSCDWQRFEDYLLQHMIKRTAGDRLRYAKHFTHVLETGNAQDLLQLPSPDKRIHAMKALAALSKYLGCHDTC